MKFLLAALVAIASGCATPEGDLLATYDASTPSFQDGKADFVGAPSSDIHESKDSQPSSWETGIDSENDAETDEADALCVADPAWEGRIETDCRGVNGSVVWKFDTSTCSWSLGALPNADPPLADGVSPLDLEWTRTTIYECPPLEE